ncbi:methylase [Lactococcus garvieae]|uniref:methylase n=1 Tax=Lactococcus garvieae TaxID=1363 RepID=UPI003852E3B2
MSEKLIKSKERVQLHGEVFTPQWMVQKMLNVEGVKEACGNIEATFLEPSAGDGNFLVAILERKLKVVTEQFSEGHWKTKSLFALSSIYGIEFLADNLEIARSRMLLCYLDWYEEVFHEQLTSKNDLYKSAMYIIRRNIVRGNTLTKKHPEYDTPILFNEWKKVKGSSSKVEKVEFTFLSLFTNEKESETGNLNRLPEGQMSIFDFGMIDEEKYEEVSKPVIIDIQKVHQLGER